MGRLGALACLSLGLAFAACGGARVGLPACGELTAPAGRQVFHGRDKAAAVNEAVGAFGVVAEQSRQRREEHRPGAVDSVVIVEEKLAGRPVEVRGVRTAEPGRCRAPGEDAAHVAVTIPIDELADAERAARGTTLVMVLCDVEPADLCEKLRRDAEGAAAGFPGHLPVEPPLPKDEAARRALGVEKMAARLLVLRLTGEPLSTRGREHYARGRATAELFELRDGTRLRSWPPPPPPPLAESPRWEVRRHNDSRNAMRVAVEAALPALAAELAGWAANRGPEP